MKTNWGKVAQFGGYALFGLVLLSVRAANFAGPEEAPAALTASLSGDTKPLSDQQLGAGQNLLSNLVLTRATYLLNRAQQEPNATAWLEQHRGSVLGKLRAADDQRGGLWKGEAEDNALAPVVVESLAIELARTWIATKHATPVATHTMKDYLASARMAGSNGRYDPATMDFYLSALGVLDNVTPVVVAPPSPPVEPETVPAADPTADTQEVVSEQ
jgi:hypothetical protein